MGRKLIITSKAKPVEGESNLFAPPAPVEKPPAESRAFLVALSWRPHPETMAQMRERYPRLNLEEELAKCLAWHHKTNTKRIKWDKTFWDWLARANGDRAVRAAQADRDARSGFRRPTEYNPADLRPDVR